MLQILFFELLLPFKLINSKFFNLSEMCQPSHVKLQLTYDEEFQITFLCVIKSVRLFLFRN